MNIVYLGLGSNLGNRAELLQQAIDLIKCRIGSVISLSDFYETAPWGFDSPHPFLNAVCMVESEQSPTSLLDATQQIETSLGRKQKSVDGTYNDRTIDIDILFYNHSVLSTPRLTIPHPLLHQRTFVLQPLAQIAPQMVHPIYKKSVAELLNTLV